MAENQPRQRMDRWRLCAQEVGDTGNSSENYSNSNCSDSNNTNNSQQYPSENPISQQFLDPISLRYVLPPPMPVSLQPPPHPLELREFNGDCTEIPPPQMPNNYNYSNSNNNNYTESINQSSSDDDFIPIADNQIITAGELARLEEQAIREAPEKRLQLQAQHDEIVREMREQLDRERNRG
ncbi:hypothetical protein HK100_011084 [Physocladia obscura]|uniref:Uncharacterized protein n=1 Tax=Physocladia obscura TaxID=109957 RepID=A0AAD5T2P3_9FUNG|nr:hypothetical protein HK100_011084 [Physocladia obscura]